MTKQELFDTVARALIAQGRPSVKDNADYSSFASPCLYRSEEGLKCAAGHLILDEEYKPDFEGSGIRYLIRFGKLGPKTLEAIGDETDFVLALQRAHDYAVLEGKESPEMWLMEWKVNMRKLSDSFSLDATVLA